MWKKKVYIKNNLTPFSINRTKIDLFFDCSRCFYLDQKHGIKKPHGTPLVINNFVVNNYFIMDAFTVFCVTAILWKNFT